MRGGNKRTMNNIRSLKKKYIAYDPNQRPSRKDDQYCAAR